MTSPGERPGAADPNATSDATFDASALLRRGDMRITRPRIAVLDALHAEPHSRAETIADTVRARLGSVSTQAVYNVLHACLASGIVRRIEPAGSPAVFELQSGDNHHHAVCRACGRIVDVACAVGLAPCLTPARDHAFDIDEAEVTFWGLCPACQSDPAIDPATRSAPTHIATTHDHAEEAAV